MIRCEEVLALSTPYIDGELPARARLAVDTHLTACTACRDALDHERHGRAALVACRDGLRAVSGERAPEHVRRAVETLRRQWPLRTGWVVRLPLAASLVLAAGAVLTFGLFSRSATLVAAQLTLDHLKCVRLVSPSRTPGDAIGVQADAGGARTPDRETMALWERTYGWRAVLPDQPTREGFELVALRRCLHGQGIIAHALYRRGDHLVSLFVFRRDVQAEGVLAIMGERTALWSQGAHTYAVVGTTAPDELSRFTALVQRAAAGPAL